MHQGACVLLINEHDKVCLYDPDQKWLRTPLIANQTRHACITQLPILTKDVLHSKVKRLSPRMPFLDHASSAPKDTFFHLSYLWSTYILVLTSLFLSWRKCSVCLCLPFCTPASTIPTARSYDLFDRMLSKHFALTRHRSADTGDQ